MFNLIFSIGLASLLTSVDLSAPASHEFYLSMIEITDTGMTVKVFRDDLENALFHSFERATDFSSETESQENLDVLQKYFEHHIQMQVGNFKVNTNPIKWKAIGDSVAITFKLSFPDKWNELSFLADYFMELYPTQMHVVKIYHEGVRKYLRLTARKKSEEISFS